MENLKEGTIVRVSSRTSPTMARSSIWAASMASCISPIWPGAASVAPPEVLAVGDEVTPRF